MYRLVLAAVAVLPLALHTPCGAQVPAPAHGLGVRLDLRPLLAQGWRESSSLADFPLRAEGKSENLLLGLVGPGGGGRIFVLYSLPAKPVAIESIDVEPPQALLARLGVRRPEASGTFEENFLPAPPLAVVHWTLVGPGDGVTFSVEAETGQQTFSLRTILSFVVVRASGERTPVVLTAFLRCPPSAVGELRPRFWALLRSLGPQEPGSKLAPARVEPPVVVADAGVFQAVGDLLGRHLGDLEGGVPVELSAAERAALEDLLAFDPSDPLARLLLQPPRGVTTTTDLDPETRQAWVAYLEISLRAAERLAAGGGWRAMIARKLRALDPQNALVVEPGANER